MTQSDLSKTPPLRGLHTYAGGCLCGAVRYEATVDLAGVSRCNCTICMKYGYGGGVGMKPDAFRLLKGQDAIKKYGRDGSPNTRSFCGRCGVVCFGDGDVPELGGKFVSIYVNTLDDVDPSLLTFSYWDGRHDNWAAGARPTPWPFQAAT